MGELEAAVLPRAVAIGVQRKEHIREIAGRDRSWKDVDEITARGELAFDPLRDIHVHVDLVDARPARSGLEPDTARERGGDLVGLPVTDLDPDAPRPCRHRRLRDADAIRLNDGTAGWRERDRRDTRNVASGIEGLGGNVL